MSVKVHTAKHIPHGVSVKDLKLTRRPETSNLYPGSVIDTLATVWWDGDQAGPLFSLYTCVFF